jgi:hypothetical protein
VRRDLAVAAAGRRTVERDRGERVPALVVRVVVREERLFLGLGQPQLRMGAQILVQDVVPALGTPMPRKSSAIAVIPSRYPPDRPSRGR